MATFCVAVAFVIDHIFDFFYKPIYLIKEVNRTDPYHSVRVPWCNFLVTFCKAAAFLIDNIFDFFYIKSYLIKEVNYTDPSNSLRVPCCNFLEFLL
jgi:hypothetical protein